MTTISERLREQAADYDEGMFDRLEWEAAAAIDELVAALGDARRQIAMEWGEGHSRLQKIDAALALARKGGK